jgi:hypothetical protein
MASEREVVRSPRTALLDRAARTARQDAGSDDSGPENGEPRKQVQSQAAPPTIQPAHRREVHQEKKSDSPKTDATIF